MESKWWYRLLPMFGDRRCRSGLRDETEDKQRDHENQTESRADPEVRIHSSLAVSQQTFGSSLKTTGPVGTRAAEKRSSFAPMARAVRMSTQRSSSASMRHIHRASTRRRVPD